MLIDVEKDAIIVSKLVIVTILSACLANLLKDKDAKL